MDPDKELFKAELSGELQKRIFKAQLQSKSIILDPELKLIIPLRPYYSMHHFTDELHEFTDTTWSHSRLRNGTLEYKDFPLLEKITETSFYLLYGWRIYHKNVQNIRFGGWTEEDKNRRLLRAYNTFRPRYFPAKSYIELTYKDTPTQVFPFPGNHKNGDCEVGFDLGTLTLETRHATSISMCWDVQIPHDENIPEGTSRVHKHSIPKMFGQDLNRFNVKGTLIEYRYFDI